MAGTLTVQTIKGPSSGANANKIIIPAGQTLDASAGFVPPAGSVLQVKSAFKSNRESFSGNGGSTFYDIGNLSVTITPASENSKILVTGKVSCSGPTGQRYGIRIVRDNASVYTAIGNADPDGVRTIGHSASFGEGGNQMDGELPISFEDSPNTTLPTTYRIQGWIEGTNTLYIGRSFAYTADSYSLINTASNLVVMEIAG